MRPSCKLLVIILLPCAISWQLYRPSDLTNGEEELAKQIKAIIVALISSDVGQSHFLTYRFMILYTRFLEYVLRSPNSEAEHSAFEYGTTASARYFAMGIADNAMRRENIDGLIGKVVFSLSNIVSLVDKLDRDTVPIRGGNNRLSSLNRLLGECQGQLEQDDVRSDSEDFIYWLLSVGSRFHNVITSEGLREIYLEYKRLEINLINMFGEHEKEKDAQYASSHTIWARLVKVQRIARKLSTITEEQAKLLVEAWLNLVSDIEAVGRTGKLKFSVLGPFLRTRFIDVCNAITRIVSEEKPCLNITLIPTIIETKVWDFRIN